MGEKTKTYKLRTIVFFSLGLTLFITLLLNTIFYVTDIKKNYLDAVEYRAASLVQSIAVDILEKHALFGALTDTQLFLSSEYLLVKRIYEANKDASISFISILSPEGTVITHSDRLRWYNQFDSEAMLAALAAKRKRTLLVDDTYHVLVPVITDEGLHLCTIDVGFPKNVVSAKGKSTVYKAVLVFVLVFLLVFVPIWLFLKKLILLPISKLIRATTAIASGDYSGSISAGTTQEFVNLSASLCHMRDALIKNIADIEQRDQEIEALVACSPVVLFSVDLQEKVAIWTSSAEQLLGWERGEVLHRRLPSIPEGEYEKFHDICRKVADGLTVLDFELQQIQKNGTVFVGSLSCAPIRDSQRNIVGVMGALRDITEQIEKEKEYKKTQEQLIQAQKMESIGRLAGGVAHDYNNMLGVIMGYTELARDRLETNHPIRHNLEEVLSATRRSADITRKLLTFARKENVSPQKIDLNQSVEAMLKMLRRLIGEDISLQWHPQKEYLGTIVIDRTQVDQILANLCVNARDAMEAGGTICIETFSSRIDDNYCRTHPSFQQGDYVVLSVSDTGIGMDKEILENIFEPFFTTKEKHKGTGLGLSTVYGIVKQNSGFIHVYSEPGKGTTFKIYFPRHIEPADEEQHTGTIFAESDAGVTILVVEDEMNILHMTKAMLEKLGYTVLIASNPEQALGLAGTHSSIDLLLTDVILGGINGRELSVQIRQIHPEIRIVFMSGYTADVIDHHGVLDKDFAFLEKPFSIEKLSSEVHKALA